MSSFWSMGGYARFVWPCFLLTAAVLGWNVWAARRHCRSAVMHARRAFAMAVSDAS